MSSASPTNIKVLRLRLKGKHAKFLSDLAHEVNFVWNYCNELQITKFNRERRFLSGFDFAKFTRGATKEGLHLHSQTVQAIAEEYATRRQQSKKVRLSWRKSTGSRRSLGWIPFKASAIHAAHGQVKFAGRWLSLWDSYGIESYQVRAGNLCEDARGRWYLNACVAAPVAGPTDRSTAWRDVGIDLGLDDLVATSAGEVCSVCSARSGPKGIAGLGIRVWTCGDCGTVHDRNVNAAKNILAAGRRRLAEGIPALEGAGGRQDYMPVSRSPSRELRAATTNGR
jgi:transposase